MAAPIFFLVLTERLHNDCTMTTTHNSILAISQVAQPDVSVEAVL